MNGGARFGLIRRRGHERPSGRVCGCVGALWALGMQRAAPWGRAHCQKQLGASIRCQQAEKPLAAGARRCLMRRGKYAMRRA